MINQRTCKVCGMSQSVDCFYRINVKRLDGTCKKCRREKIAAYAAVNTVQVRATKARYYRENSERVKEAVRERYWADPEAARESRRRTFRKHHEKILAANRARSPKYATKRSEYHAKYKAKDPVAYKARYADLAARRRVRLLAGDWEQVDRAVIIARDGSRCHICGKKCRPSEIHLDHLIPVSKGGPHTAANLAVACSHCNLRRSDGKLPAQLRLVG